MELSFLTDSGLLDKRCSTGVVRTLPASIQERIAVQMIDYFHTNFTSAMKASIRSKEDLTYVIESIGPCFAFSVAEHHATINKALEVYAMILNPSTCEVVPEVLGVAEIRCHFICEMMRHQSMLFFPQRKETALPHHTNLIGKMLDQISLFATSSDLVPCPISEATWHLILRVLFGSLLFCFENSDTYHEIRSSLASVAFECLVRSKTRSPEMWDIVKKLLRAELPVSTAWRSIFVALTRAISTMVSQTLMAPPANIVVCWNGMLKEVRKSSVLREYDQSTISFVWKKMFNVFGPLDEITDPATLATAIGGLRDAVTLLVCSAFWTPNCDVFGEKPHDGAFNFSPNGPSISSLVKSCFGPISTVLHVRRNEPAYQMAVANAIETLCGTFANRELEAAVSEDIPYIAQFYSTLNECLLAPTSATRSTTLRFLWPLHSIDMVVPRGLIQTIIVASEKTLLSTGAEQSAERIAATEDVEEDDEVSETDDCRTGALLNLVAACADASRREDGETVFAIMNVMLRVVNHYSKSPSFAQFALTAALMCASHAQKFEPCAKILTSLCECSADVIRVVQETIIPPALQSIHVLFLGMFPHPTEAAQVSACVSLCMYAQALKRCEAASSGDPQSLAELFSLACFFIGEILVSHPTVIMNDAVALSILRLFDVASTITTPESYLAREAALLLFNVATKMQTWPVIDSTSLTDTLATETDFAEKATSCRAFAVNGDRIVTLIEGPAAPGDAEPWLVMIVRDQFGRRCWHWKRRLNEREREGPWALPSTMVATNFQESASAKSDSLRFVGADPRTSVLLSQWEADPTVAEALSDFASEDIAQESTEHSVLHEHPLANPSHVGPESVHSALGRMLMYDLGFLTQRTKELHMTDDFAASIRAIDLLPAHDVFHIDVISIMDDCNAGENAFAAFDNFCASLAWNRDSDLGLPDTGPGRRRVLVFRTPLYEMYFHVVSLTASEFDSFDVNGRDKDEGETRVRILWDETTARYNWSSMECPLHDTFRQLAPYWRPSAHKRTLDIVVTPLHHAGTHSIRLYLPKKSINDKAQYDPFSWGAPLLHGSVVTSSVLPELVRKSALHACLCRAEEHDRVPAPLIRRRALHAVAVDSSSDFVTRHLASLLS